MENEKTWIQGDVLSEKPMQAVGRLLASNLWCTIPELCKLVEGTVMPAIHSPSTAFTSLSAKRPYSPWNPEPRSPPSKRSKVRSSSCDWGRVSSSRQLASFPCSVSPAENPYYPSECWGEVRICNSEDAGKKSPGLRPQKCFDTGVESMSSSVGMAHSRMSAEEKISSENWELRVVASSRCNSPSLVASDVIGTIDFNAEGELFATGGIARKIRICSYAKMTNADTRKSSDEDDELYLDEDDDDLCDNKHKSTRRNERSYSGPTLDHGDCAVAEISTPGKLSNVKWRPDGSEVIGCGDYDGVVSEWDIEYKHTVSEWYEHSGQRVWSLDYSRLRPTLAASASDDGTVRLWNRGTEMSVSTIRPPGRSSLCCAEFSPFSPYHMAVASADSSVYLYDLRNPDSSLLKLVGHEKAVSYVRFLGKDKVVSASVDSTLKLWDISSQAGASPNESKGDVRHHDHHLDRTFTDHVNVKNFVGLSVHRGAGIFACGSETNEVFIYSNWSSVPLQRHKLPRNGLWGRSGENPFVGAVCWREKGNNYTMVAANSEGVVQVLEAQKVDTV